MFLILVFLVLGSQLIRLPSDSIKTIHGDGKLVVVDSDRPVSTHYKYLLKKYPESFPSLTLEKKCQIYFNELYKMNHDWEVIDKSIELNKDYNKGAFDHDRFIRERVSDFKKEKDRDPSDSEKAEFELQFQGITSKTLDIEQAMVDAVTHLRVFGSCFLSDHKSSITSDFVSSWWGGADQELETITHNNNFDLCQDIEQRLFPWISKELPLFVRWDGEKVYGIPIMSKYITDDGYDDKDLFVQTPIDMDFTNENPQDETLDSGKEKPNQFFKREEKSNCFLNPWRKALNGKGIVLSVADRYEHDITGLLRVLRALNNKLPIQLVHKGDLSEAVQKRIVEVARDDEVKVPEGLYDQVKSHVPRNFPKQEVWFVNAKRSIRPEFRGNFNGFANKLIAFLFNSFDHTILMDTDSVPLVKPSTFFKSGAYSRMEAYFFKDRFTSGKVSQHDSDYFLKLMPTEVDNVLFGVPAAGNLTLQNRYIAKQFKHVQEAGVVAIRRSTHFIGMLTTLQLNFWSAAAGSRVWGDKELFWLGQSISGNENYEFNKHDTISVGELTPMSDRPRNTIAHELCSTHPGHLSSEDDMTVLWVNSGMRYCKVDNTWDKDIEHERFKNVFKDSAELAEFYKKPFRISAALIPPGGDHRVENKNNEPAGGWAMTNPCKGYLWCAYDILGASTDPINRGTYIEYDNVTINTNEYLGLLWLDQDLINLSEYEGMKGEREKGDLNVIIEK